MLGLLKRSATANSGALPLLFLFLFLFLFAVFNPAYSDLAEDDDDLPLVELRDQIEAGQAEDAVGLLHALLADEPDNADIHNLLGFAHRHLQQFETARHHYQRALTIDPFHLGALEYLGEMELQLGDVAAAKGRLSNLERLCPSGCEELDELRQAIANDNR